MAKTVVSVMSIEDKNIKSDNLSSSKNKHLRGFRKNTAVISICSLTLVIILLIVTIIVILKHQTPVTIMFSKSSTVEISHNESISPTELKTNFFAPDNSNFRIITRTEWLAEPPVEALKPLSTPAPYVVIHHTATHNCFTQNECHLLLRYIQSFHIHSRNWWDIGYNFVVGGDGKVYEARGWKYEGAHTYNFNKKSIGIGFLGNFEEQKPPKRQLEACKKLITEGVNLGYIKKDYKLYGAKQLVNAQSPGVQLFEEIKTWPHIGLERPENV